MVQARSHQAVTEERWKECQVQSSSGEEGGPADLGLLSSGGREQGQQAVVLNHGCILEPPRSTCESRCMSHTLTVIRSEPGDGGRRRVAGQ